ncbi:MAG: hypothetical protein LBD71_00015 [Treponema sp.]|nr:hypothetical protein [Treponema sp.]
MRKNRTELEEAINNSPFFSIPGENWSARATAKTALVNDLWEYCKDRPLHPGNHKSKTYQDYGEEVWKAIESSIRLFDPNKGDSFLHFFNAGCKRFLAKELKRKEEKEDCSNRPNARKPVSGDTLHNPEEKKPSTIFDMTADFVNEYHYVIPVPAETLEKKEEEKEIFRLFFETIEEAFLERQKRIQPWLRALWTLRCFDVLAALDLPQKKYAWIDYDFLDKYRNAEKPPAQKEVAALYGRSEQAASRDLASFRETVVPRIQAFLKNNS